MWPTVKSGQELRITGDTADSCSVVVGGGGGGAPIATTRRRRRAKNVGGGGATGAAWESRRMSYLPPFRLGDVGQPVHT